MDVRRRVASPRGGSPLASGRLSTSLPSLVPTREVSIHLAERLNQFMLLSDYAWKNFSTMAIVK